MCVTIHPDVSLKKQCKLLGGTTRNQFLTPGSHWAQICDITAAALVLQVTSYPTRSVSEAPDFVDRFGHFYLVYVLLT